MRHGSTLRQILGTWSSKLRPSSTMLKLLKKILACAQVLNPSTSEIRYITDPLLIPTGLLQTSNSMCSPWPYAKVGLYNRGFPVQTQILCVLIAVERRTWCQHRLPDWWNIIVLHQRSEDDEFQWEHRSSSQSQYILSCNILYSLQPYTFSAFKSYVTVCCFHRSTLWTTVVYRAISVVFAEHCHSGIVVLWFRTLLWRYQFTDKIHVICTDHCCDESKPNCLTCTLTFRVFSCDTWASWTSCSEFWVTN